MGYRFKMWMKKIVQALINQGFLSFIFILILILPLHPAVVGNFEV